MKCYLTYEQLTGTTIRTARFFFFLTIAISCGQALGQLAQTPIRLDTKNLLVSVDPNTCRWSAKVKGTAMQMNDIYFLPGNDPSSWKVVSSVNEDDSNNLGSFMTVTLVGTKTGQLDFN